MFTLIDGLPPYAVGVTARERITKDDYEETLLPALKKAAAEWKGINFIFVMETDFSSFSLGAWLQDIKVNVQYFLKWNKVAVVSEKDGLDLVTRVFFLLSPGETKIFSLADLEVAKEWIATP